MTKPKIALLERIFERPAAAHSEAVIALLRLARAAKEAQELLVSEDAADAAIHHAYDSALDAFDWGEK